MNVFDGLVVMFSLLELVVLPPQFLSSTTQDSGPLTVLRLFRLFRIFQFARRYGINRSSHCCSVVWCGVVWCGVVWCGVVWCGVVEFDMVWCVGWCVGWGSAGVFFS